MGIIATMVDYKDRLKWAMDERKVSVSELAAALGVKYQAIKKVFDGGTKSLNAKNNALAARALQVSAHWLATNEGDPFAPDLAVHQPDGSVLIAEVKSGPSPQPRTAGEFIAAAASKVAELPAADRDSVAQLAAMMLRSGPSVPLTAAIDEVAGRTDEPRMPTQAEIEQNRLLKRQQWEELVQSMAADMPAERRAEFDRSIDTLRALYPTAPESRPVARGVGDTRKPRPQAPLPN